MSKAVVYTGAGPSLDEEGEEIGEWQNHEDITDVTVADGVSSSAR
jgi:hypothetical protein